MDLMIPDAASKSGIGYKQALLPSLRDGDRSDATTALSDIMTVLKHSHGKLLLVRPKGYAE